MSKRIFIVVFFIPMIALTLIQIPIETIRWVITGKQFNDPWFDKFIFGDNA